MQTVLVLLPAPEQSNARLVVVLIVAVDEIFSADAFGAIAAFGADLARALVASFAADLHTAVLAFPGLEQS